MALDPNLTQDDTFGVGVQQADGAIQSPDARTRNEDAPQELVKSVGDYLRKRYATGSGTGVTEDSYDSAATDMANRIHRETNATYERQFSGATTPEEQVALVNDRVAAQLAAKKTEEAAAEFQKAKALNPNLDDAAVAAGLAEQENRERLATERVAGVVGAVSEFGPLKAVGEVAQQSADIGEGVLGVGLQKGAEAAGLGRGKEEAATTAAVTSETDQQPAWLRPFTTPILYAAAAGETKRIAQERAGLPSVDIGGVKLDVLDFAEMGLPLGGLGEAGLKGASKVSKLARAGRTGELTATQIIERIAGDAVEKAPLDTSVSNLSARLDARAAALEAAGDPGAVSARELASRNAAIHPGAEANEALAKAKGAEFEPGTGAALKPKPTVSIDITEKTNPAAVEQVKNARKNGMGEFLRAEGGSATLGGASGADLVKAASRVVRGDQGAMVTSEGAQQKARELTRGLQEVAGGKGTPLSQHPIFKEYGSSGSKGPADKTKHGGDIGTATRAVMAGDRDAMNLLGPNLTEELIRNKAAQLLRDAGVSDTAIQTAFTNGDTVVQVASKVVAQAPSPEASDLLTAATKAIPVIKKAEPLQTTMFGDAEKPLSSFNKEKPPKAGDALPPGDNGSGVKAPASQNPSAQPPFGPERMPGDVEPVRQPPLRSADAAHLDAKGKPVKVNGKPVKQVELAPEFGAGDAKVPHEPTAFPNEPIKAGLDSDLTYGSFDSKTGELVPNKVDSAVKQLRAFDPHSAIAHDLEKLKWWEQIASTANLPRSIKAAFDLSAPLRQGLVLSTAHPISAARATRDMLHAFADSKFAGEVDRMIRNSPFNADGTYEKMKLYIAPLDESAALSDKEEAFMSKALMGELNVFGKDVNLYRKSQFAYTTYLNKLRSDVADNAIRSALNSKGGGFNDAELKALGAFINHATGRGDLGALTKYGPALSALFFSPRYTISRVNALGDAAAILKQPGNRATQMAAADMAKFIGAGVSVLALGKMAHEAGIPGFGDVEIDPRSPEFGKLQIGESDVDLWGGFQQIARYGAQFATNEKKAMSGKNEGEIVDVGPTWLAGAFKTGSRFVESKLSPTASFVADIKKGQDALSQTNSEFAKAAREAEGLPVWDQPIGVDYVGNIFTLKDALNPTSGQGLFTPLGPSDVRQSIEAEMNVKDGNPVRGALVGALGLFGAGITQKVTDESAGLDTGAPEENPFLKAYSR